MSTSFLLFFGGQRKIAKESRPSTWPSADGRYGKLLYGFARTNLLVLDDWGLSKLNKEQQRDFLEIIEDRDEIHSTVITSQVPVSHWHEVIDDPTLADAILDRLVHNTYKINLKGESMRKKKRKLT